MLLLFMLLLFVLLLVVLLVLCDSMPVCQYASMPV
jgi:hypothetical protein